MEMEHINENTIRVLIENSDLAERGITFLDLLGNYKQIEKFFYSILEEVDIDREFIETDAITFQVMPNQKGIELFISKMGEDGESAFDLSQVIEPYLKGEQSEENVEFTEVEEVSLPEEDGQLHHWLVKLNDFEDVIMLAKSYYLQSGYTQLFHYHDAYYLHVAFVTDDMPIDLIHLDEALMLEYGEAADQSLGQLREHGDVLIENDALETLRYYFKK